MSKPYFDYEHGCHFKTFLRNDLLKAFKDLFTMTLVTSMIYICDKSKMKKKTKDLSNFCDISELIESKKFLKNS